MNLTPRVTSALLAGLCCLLPGACTTGTSPNTSTASGGDMTGDPSSLDPDRPEEPVTGLPDDAGALNREVYRRLVQQWKPILAAFDMPPAEAYFVVHSGVTGQDGSVPAIEVDFGPAPRTRWDEIEQEMAAVVKAQGWTACSHLHGLNVRKGLYYLEGGCNSSTGCGWTIESSLIPRRGLAPDPKDKVVTKLLPGGTTRAVPPTS